MKLIMNKKNTGDSITLELEPTTTVKELLLILYDYRSKIYDRLSFNEYQKYISVYQCLLYGDRFKNKLLPETNLADYPLENPCYLTWEEFTEERCLSSHNEPIGNKLLFWQDSMKPVTLEIEKEPLSDRSNESIESVMP
ncbi:hypothetical protein OQJ19_08670 [Fluoribacter gormanii]|uniref:Ubiquitin-like domain-containing protein n=2 Tax=Fluoribacter gormanii TaxID=464 RepID=A0A377GN04_9GAMM|nr:hypothetical protein Lgor_1002 [Fluoribacter gormanii]MCW8445475.1 hypothetical protein [Fluoribacter gormanii]MCW8470725.1 hypothetical protein [Fluoribacter gormanii]SIR89087.1 hypothetical protein SAMN05421777_1372 [Fluoribacter gormanii]STO26158.1 Uncharacterised protein [Fluoribacter gormanii]